MSPAQAQMRDARAPRKPVLKVFIVLVILAAAAFAFYKVRASGGIHAFGLVTGSTVKLTAPERSTVRGMFVQRGDRVNAGAPLFSLHSEAAATDRRIQETEVKSLETSLKALEEKGQTMETRAAERLREVNAAQQQLSILKERLATQKTDAAKAAVARRHEIARAEEEVAKLEQVYAQKKERHEKLQALAQMDAAVKSEVEAARIEMLVAEHNLNQGRLDRKLAQDRDAVTAQAEQELAKQLSDQIEQTAAQLQQVQAVYDQVAQEGKRDLSADVGAVRGRIEAAKALLEKYKQLEGPTEYRAPCDGFVLGIDAPAGNAVEAGETVLVLASAADLSVDAYLPSRSASRVHAGVRVLVYAPGVSQAVEGTIAADSGYEVPAPAQIKVRMPKMTESLYARITLDSPDGLLPGSVVRVVVPAQ